MSARKRRLVRAIDTEAVRPLLAAVYEALYGDPLDDRLKVEEQVLVVGWNDSFDGVDIGTVCNEGVGNWLTDSNCIEVWVMGGFQRFTIPLGLNRIPLREEPVDLAGAIRTFGARLESNWYQWDYAAEKALAKGIPAHLEPFVVA